MTPATWLVIMIEILAGLIVVIILHKVGMSILRPMALSLHYSGRLLRYASRSGRVVLFLYAVLMILHHSPDHLQAIETVRRIDLIALVVAVTVLGVRCINAVAHTIIDRNPAASATNIDARRIQTQTRVLARCASALIVLVGLGLAFSTMPVMRRIEAVGKGAAAR